MLADRSLFPNCHSCNPNGIRATALCLRRGVGMLRHQGLLVLSPAVNKECPMIRTPVRTLAALLLVLRSLRPPMPRPAPISW